MLRYIFQIISFQVLAGLFLAGCVALAQGPSSGGAEVADEAVRGLLWRLGGWVRPLESKQEGFFERAALAPGPKDGKSLSLSMIYSDALASWPVAIKASCLPNGKSGPIESVSDKRPFGGANIAGVPPESLAPCLASLVSALEEGVWIERPSFEEIEPGLFLAVSEANYGPRLGSREVVMIKASMSQFRLAPYHEGERDQWAASPVTVKGWMERLPSAVLIFNAGQYYPDRRHMGTLVRDGSELPGKTHESWKGFVVQGRRPSSEEQGAKSLKDWDLLDEDTRLPGALGPDAYATVIQTHMVIDRLGRVRVRDTDRLASRSALAVDSAGDLWLVAVPGAISLYDLGLLLKKLDLVSAVGLDGGLESQVALKAGGDAKFWLGRASNNFLGNFLVDDLTPPLPAVIALERIEQERL
ncbi:MAG: phosphodiester glycosidase family protein [Deltaproteobacteria bacterium]|jgi:hypothetical protein|nr:phosphodiester glycosidase family protein [Deltaproteobacteria bacterium]